TEVADQTLDWPGSGIAEGADGVALDLPGHLFQDVDFLDPRLALHQALHDAIHPARTLAAGRALAAALMHVEMREPADRGHRGRAEARFHIAKGIEIHQHRVADRARNDGHGCPAGNDAKQVVPAAANAAGVALDELLQRNAHLLFHVARLVHMAGDAEDLG